jgi:hypothetical protein
MQYTLKIYQSQTNFGKVSYLSNRLYFAKIPRKDLEIRNVILILENILNEGGVR